MLTRLRTPWSRPDTPDSEDPRREWERLLANASSPQERDEINDVFSRALAA